MKHTPTPWKLTGEVENETEAQYIINEKTGTKICDITAYDFWGLTVESANANAKRIVACVNALDGIDAPELWVKSIHETSEKLLKEKEEIGAALGQAQKDWRFEHMERRKLEAELEAIKGSFDIAHDRLSNLELILSEKNKDNKHIGKELQTLSDKFTDLETSFWRRLVFLFTAK